MLYITLRISSREWRGDEKNDGKGYLIFAYAWSLLLFCVISWYGNAVLVGFLTNDEHHEKKWWNFWLVSASSAMKEHQIGRTVGVLMGSIVTFACFSFLLFIVSMGLIFGREGGDEGFGMIFKSFDMVVILSFAFWTVFFIGFSWMFMVMEIFDPTPLAVEYKNDADDRKAPLVDN